MGYGEISNVQKKLMEQKAEIERMRVAAEGALAFLMDQYREENPLTGEAFSLEARPHISALIDALHGGDDGG